MTFMKKRISIISALVVLTAVGATGICWYMFSIPEEVWVTYTNERYGYRVLATEGYGRILEENLAVIEADGASGEVEGKESRVFYFKDIGLGGNDLGFISCYDHDEAQPWPELSNSMSLEDYARTLYAKEILIDVTSVYDRQIILEEIEPILLDGREAYSYVYAREKAGGFDTRVSVITESPEGKKCHIMYAVTYVRTGYDAKMLENKLRWFNSFEWIR